MDSIFRDLNVLGRRKLFGGAVTVYKIGVTAEDLPAVLRRVQENMRNRLLFMRQEFYAHFYRGPELIIVFGDRLFRVGIDPSTWREAIEHGRRLGIAKGQLDFSPCRIEEETY